MKIQIRGKECAAFERYATPGTECYAVFGGSIWTKCRKGTIERINKNSFRIRLEDGNMVTIPNMGQRTYSKYNCMLPISMVEVD